jgi:hypothetical protein
MPQAPVGAHHGAGTLIALLVRAGITRSSVIRVTGPGALTTLIWLCRHGYEQVGYVRPGEGAPHEDADAIIVAHTCDVLELKQAMTVARQVRPGGAFLFLLRSDHSPVGVDWLLETAGLQTDERVDAGRRTLVIARRSLPFRKAA